MTGLLDIRLQSSDAILDAVRRVEYLLLLGLSLATVVLFPGYAALAAMPLVVVALMLVPTQQRVAVCVDERLATLNAIQNEGLLLRSRWVALEQRPLDQGTALEKWSVRRETIVWLYRSSQSLRKFPEVAGIFDAGSNDGDIVDELDFRLVTLSRLRRLVSLSESLKLPI